LSAFVGDNTINKERRLSARVTQVQGNDLDAEEFRVVPLRQFGQLVGFNNWFPIGKDDAHSDLTHPTDWLRVTNPSQWDALDIGAPLFHLHTGDTAGGWKHGYYLVNKR
jgi:hypothetical protein